MPPARTSRADTPGKRLLRRVIWGAVLLSAVAFAIEGGEYGTFDVLMQKGRKERLQVEVEAMRVEVESLRAEVKTVNTDDARLERIARERFGMVKGDKEVLYWTARRSDSASSVNRSPGAGARDTL